MALAAGDAAFCIWPLLVARPILAFSGVFGRFQACQNWRFRAFAGVFLADSCLQVGPVSVMAPRFVLNLATGLGYRNLSLESVTGVCYWRLQPESVTGNCYQNVPR